MFGSLVLACFVMFIIVMLKKREISIVLSLLGVILPIMIFSGNAFVYKIPGAAGLLSSSGYFYPTKYTYDIIESEKFVSFQAIEKSYLLGLLVINTIIVIALIAITFIRFSHSRIAFTLASDRKGMGIIATLGLCSCLTLSGCESSSDDVRVKIDSTLTAQISVIDESSEYYIEQNENVIYRKDEDGNVVAITRDVFPLGEQITNIFVDKNKCYYMLESDSNTNFVVRCIDLDSFDDELIYSSGTDNVEDFYGLVSDDVADAEKIFDNIATVNWFFVTGNWIYYQKENAIYRCNIKTKSEQIIDEAVSDGEIRYEAGVLYYVDAYGDDVIFDEEK